MEKTKRDIGISRESAKLLVGEGWHMLIDLAYDYIEDADISVMQVKEKFGELRIYTGLYIWEDDDSPTTHEEQRRRHTAMLMRGVVRAVEHMSRYTCETCGKPGEIKNIQGWYKAVCEDHEKGEW